MKKIFYIILVIQLMLTVILTAQNIVVVTPPQEYITIKTENIKNIIDQNSQQLKLANNLTKVFYTKNSEEFIIVKLNRFAYKVSFVLIKTNGTKFEIKDANYTPQMDDFDIYHSSNSIPKVLTGTTDYLFDTACDDYPTAVSAINTVSGYASNQNYSVSTLIGSAATVSAIQSGITNNDLIAMGNVGHGSTSGIWLDDGFLNYNWFASQDLSGEIFYFNSCQTFNDPLKSSITNSGGSRTYVAGIVDLPVGPSEEVFKDFFDYTLNDGWEMGNALVQGEINNNLIGYHDLDGDNGVMNLTTAGTLRGNEVWAGSVILNDQVTVPSGVTLTIKSTSTINLNGHKLLSSGNNIVVESGANFNYSKLKNSSSTLLGYYPTVQSAINDAQTSYTVELQSATYSENLSLTNKSSVKLKGAGIGSTTINGNITITNSTYAQVSDFTMGNYKNITVNGGYRPYLTNIGFNNTNANSYVFIYDGDNTNISGLNNFGASTEPAWRFYNSYTGNISYSSIEGYDFGINAASYSEIAMSSMSFCNNMVDLWASSGCWIYATHSSLSYNGAYYGNCTFGYMYAPCGSKAERRDDSQLAKNSVEQFTDLGKANSAFRALLMDEEISKASKLTENSKNKVKDVIEQYKNILGTNISKTEIKEALSKLSVCNRMLDEETVFADYVTDLISNKKVPSEMKRFLIPNLVSKGNYNQAINLIDEISAYQDVSDDLKYELLYEKGTIQKYYLNEADQSEKVFAELYKNGGDHILARYAKAQLNNESSLDDGSNPKTGDNSEVDNGFAISSYPNPFNPTATIEYQIPKDGLVNLVVYNTLGQVVAELVNEHQSSGKYSVQFSASNLPSGIYFYKIESGSFSKSMKMLLLK